MEEKKELYAKMAQVMGKVGYIKKRGRNQAQGYDYVMAADIAGDMAQLLSEIGLAFAPVQQDLAWETRESNRGTSLFVCRLSVIYSLMDVDTGQNILIPSFGEGMDAGDKAAYKAMTGALKYALIQTFLIAAGDDPEEEKDDGLGQIEVKPTPDATKVADRPLSVMQQSNRKVCPECGAEAIIKGRPEFGGGYVCYKKLGGCNAKYSDSDPRLGGVHVVRGSDSNGHAETQSTPERERISQAQLEELRAWCVTFGVDQAAVLRQYKMRDPSIETLADLTQEMFEHASKVFATKKEKANRMN